MFEVILIVIVMFAMAACAFSPLGYSMAFFSKSSQQSPVANQQRESAADSELAILKRSNHLLTRLQSEIESSFGPRPTESVLRRHYDTLVASEFEARLAALVK